jgi:hypothetical protein
MGKIHDETVAEVFEELKKFEDNPDVRWDYVGREVDYWRTPETTDCEKHLMYDQKGDFDILGLDYENEQAYIVEVKTNQNAATKGYKQLKKAEEHFQALDWDTIPCLLMKDGELKSSRPSYASD